jgi:protein-tyrosine phosphatase
VGVIWQDAPSDEGDTTPVGDVGRVLVVCTANICRSPVAEALLESYLARVGGPAGADVVVTSAGTHARMDDAAAPPMVDLCDTWGLDIAPHRSRKATPAVVAAQDLIITMEVRHRDIISRLAPGVGERTFTLTELAGLLALTRHLLPAAGSEAGPGLGPRLRAVVGIARAARVRVAVDAPDVDDPYGGPLDGYAACASLLADTVTQLGDDLQMALSA